ncbi:uncharacterized protein LOC129721825 isoform X2 [Wyeomyia smithii]|uniref:uncharacterized protein LOC129721825 isoform X2 n=1 Tax=Wyeomyia smithii TaxID=174621 RepID=UPI002467BC75|nr:uncharacterized protein LOC129721825 isoform X2 [Wyeomyia smithii]
MGETYKSTSKSSAARSYSKSSVSNNKSTVEPKDINNELMHQSGWRLKSAKAYILDKSKAGVAHIKTTTKHRSIHHSIKPQLSNKIKSSDSTKQNVTIYSPPIKKKIPTSIIKHSTDTQLTRDRTRTRTLKQEEISMLKNTVNVSDRTVFIPKPSIVFHIPLHEHAPRMVDSTLKTHSNSDGDAENDSDQYESEFDSYESDTESPCRSSSSSSSKLPSNCKFSSSDTDTSCSLTRTSEFCHYQEMQSHDSVRYNLTSQREQTTNDVLFGSIIQQQQVTNYLNSGINNDDIQIIHTNREQIHQRKIDIFNKITLNVMCFNLYEEQPVMYEFFVQFHGNVTGVQNHCQTEMVLQEKHTQTDDVYYKSCWSQHPPRYSINTLCNIIANHEACLEEKLSVKSNNYYVLCHSQQQNDMFSNFLQYLENQYTQCMVNQTTIPENRLLSFLQNSLTVIERIHTGKLDVPKKISKKIHSKQHKMLNQSSVITTFSDLNQNEMFFTLHDYHKESILKHFICVWNKKHLVQPKSILTCWDIITCLERIGPIFIGGTINGTLCLWNEREYKTEKNPFQIISPDIAIKDKICHHGKVIAAKCVAQYISCKSRTFGQVLTLFERGTLITWSLVSITEAVDFIANTKLDITFNNAKFKLVQQFITNLFGVHTNAKLPKNDFAENFENSATERNATSAMIVFPLLTCMLVHQNTALILCNGYILLHKILENRSLFLFNDNDIITHCIQQSKRDNFIITSSPYGAIQIHRIHPDKGIQPKLDNAY